MKGPDTVDFQRLDEFTAAPRKALWTLAVPTMIGMSISTLYMVVDMIFVGHVGTDALTALAFNLPFSFVVMGIIFGLGSGITALIAQAIGAKDQASADSAARHSLALGLLLSVLFTAVGLLFGQDILRVLGVTDELMEPAWDYFKVIAIGYPFMINAIFLRSILSGEGEVKLPVMIQLSGTLLNIILDPIFIFTLGLGVQGAAAATVLSQCLVTLTLAYLLFFRGRAQTDIHLGRLRWRNRVIADIFRIGVPASLSFLIIGSGSAIFNRILSEVSTNAVAALQVGARLDYVVILPVVAISGSLVTLVGMFHGAKRNDLVESTVRYALASAMGIAVGISVLFYFTAPWIVTWFSDNLEIQALSVQYLRIIVFTYPLMALSMITGRFLQGLGRGTPELMLSALRVLVVAVPLATYFIFWMQRDVQWVWIAALIGSVTSASVAALWLRSALKGLKTETSPLPQPDPTARVKVA